jgi:hypothetical protein
MDKFSMAMGITLLNRTALSVMSIAQVARESKSTTLVHLSSNGRGWNGMFPKK